MDRTCINLVGNTVTAQNMGGGAGVFIGKNTASNLQFRTISATGTSIQIYQTDDRILISGGSGGSTTFVGLTDTPNNYVEGKWLRVSGNSIVYVDAPSGGVTTFLGLTDTPNSYTSPSQANKWVRVNSGATGVEFWNGLCGQTNAQSTILGCNAGPGNLGGNNVIIGQNAGSTPFTYNYVNNVFVGGSSGSKNESGIQNTFVGHASGINNTSGYDNTFLGHYSGGKNTTGNRNVFIGRGSGDNNVDGEDNIAIGFMAACKAESTFHNVSIGMCAGFNSKYTSSNIYIGSSSGALNVSGSCNVFIGRGSGFNNISGSCNVFIGMSSGVNELGSNKLYITNSSTSTPLIYGEFDTTPTNQCMIINGKMGLPYISSGSTGKALYYNTSTGSVSYDDPSGGSMTFTGLTDTPNNYVNDKWLKVSGSSLVYTDAPVVGFDSYGTLTSSSTVSWDTSTGLNKSLTRGGNFTLNITNLDDGMSGDLRLNITSSTTMTIGSITDYTRNYILNSLISFTSNQTTLAIGTYHLAFVAGSNWIDFNIAEYGS